VRVRTPLPTFDRDSAAQKVQSAEDAWNTRDPERVASARLGRSQAGQVNRRAGTGSDQSRGAIIGNDVESGWREQPGQQGQFGPAETGALVDVLEAHGFEPPAHEQRPRPEQLPIPCSRPRNPDLVRGMNLNLIEGFLEGLGQTVVRARLDPGPSRCCVRVQTCEHAVIGSSPHYLLGSRARSGRPDWAGAACRGLDGPLPADR
jgi:hypothetical protein